MSGTATLEDHHVAEGEPIGVDQVSVLAALDGCLDRLGDVDLAGLDPDALAGHLAGLERVATRLQAVGMGALRIFDGRGVWDAEGAYSAANWVVTATGTNRADAAGRVRLARALGEMPVAAAALAAGEITLAHVRLLSRCLGPRTRDAFAAAEADLVGHARVLRADHFAKAVRYWLELVDPDGAEPGGDEGPERAQMSQSASGRWLLGAEFGDAVGAELDAAIREKMDELYRRDRGNSEIDPTDHSALRPSAERRADAIAELIRQGAAAPGNPARRRPAVTVIVDAPTLAAIFGADHHHDPCGEEADPFADITHELLDGTVVRLDTLRRWACDAFFSRVVFGPDGEPIDVGRLERYATDAQRRALAARDRGCAVPSCDRPASWCDAHHIAYWEDGGGTDIDNLVLLCRHHHTRIHSGHVRVRMVEHRPVFHLPDGRPITGRRQQERPPDTG